MSTLEEQKKVFLPFLQRADEVANVNPKVAYYCRMYAAEQAIAIPNRDPRVSGILNALLATLERDKPTLNLGPDDQAYCENFALTVFARADKIDRAEKADKNTAKAFYAASIFIEILNQFGELPPDLADVQRYAAWKAADIGKALREGRQPTPGPPGNASLSILGAVSSTDLDLPAPPGIADDGWAPEGPSAPGPGVSQPLGPPPAPLPHVDMEGAGAPTAPPPAGPGVSRSSSTVGTAGSPVSRSDSAAGPASSSPPSGPPKFPRGSKVIYREGISQGTVAKVDPRSDGVPGWLYHVALSTHFVTASEDDLAMEYPPGARVLLHVAEGPPVQATVSHANMATWPPMYLVTTPDNRTVDTPGDSLSPCGEVPTGTSEGRHLSASQSGPLLPPQAPVTSGPGPGGPQLPPRPPAPSSSSAAPSAPVSSVPAPGKAPAAPHAYQAMPQGHKPDLLAITEAQKLAKYAASSLSFEDVNTAVDYLNEALRLLTQPGAHPKDGHSRSSQRR
eukprot:jgi/Botrbrau1/9811/Bobra.0322s0016.1